MAIKNTSTHFISSAKGGTTPLQNYEAPSFGNLSREKPCRLTLKKITTKYACIYGYPHF